VAFTQQKNKKKENKSGEEKEDPNKPSCWERRKTIRRNRMSTC